MSAPNAADFDEWYVNMSASARQQAIQQAHLGLPPELESSSLLPWDGIADVAAAVRVRSGDVLVDLACGRGGYGLEVARRTGAQLVGIDFSAVAIERARQRQGDDWADVTARFAVGELTATGLPDGSAEAVMCVDAMQFADPYGAGLAECRRILRPGGRLVLTGWEPRSAADEAVPARLRHDIAAAVAAAGFIEVDRRDMAAWQEAERSMWAAAVAAEPDGDPAMESMRSEGERVLETIDLMRRLCVSARVPPDAS
jgi:ubiquinone/menaquinone biosynthesis C-methylase UbiE